MLKKPYLSNTHTCVGILFQTRGEIAAVVKEDLVVLIDETTGDIG